MRENDVLERILLISTLVILALAALVSFSEEGELRGVDAGGEALEVGQSRDAAQEAG